MMLLECRDSLELMKIIEVFKLGYFKKHLIPSARNVKPVITIISRATAIMRLMFLIVHRATRIEWQP